MIGEWTVGLKGVLYQTMYQNFSTVYWKINVIMPNLKYVINSTAPTFVDSLKD